MARSLLEGQIPVNDEIEQQLSRCLLCSACVYACPIDVPVPDIVMLAKEKIAVQKKQDSFFARAVQNFFFDKLLPYSRRMQLLGHLLWIYQKSGLRQLVRKSGMMRLFPQALRQMEGVIPEMLPPRKRRPLPAFTPHATKSEGVAADKKAALFSGCIMDVMFRQTNQNSIQLLAESGFDVAVPDGQGCCGALHFHNGKKGRALELAKRNIEAFEQADADIIVTSAGGCGAMLFEYEKLFLDDPVWLARARRFSSKVRDISAILLEHGAIPDTAGDKERVTYQPSCHLQYVMKMGEAPRRLLKRTADYVELPDAKLCCGSAGIYNLIQGEMADRILDQKMSHVKSTQADIVITANPGCLLQMQAGIARAGLSNAVKAMHIVDYLAKVGDRAGNRTPQKTNEKQHLASVSK
jgi:glycolate oxidase iron-sulfur subunit